MVQEEVGKMATRGTSSHMDRDRFHAEVELEVSMFEHGIARMMPSRCEHGVPMEEQCLRCEKAYWEGK